MDQEPKLLPEAIETFRYGHELYLQIMAIRAAKAENASTEEEKKDAA